MVPPVDPARQTAAAPPLVVPIAAALPPVAAALAPKPAEPLPPVTPAAPAPPRIPLPPVAEAAPAKPADPGPVIPAWAPESPPSKPADPGPPSAPALAPATGPDLAASDKAGAPGPRQPVQGTHGHAADYTWLQGILDKHYLGHLNLRYCDCTVEDTWGGKVRLLDDPRLAQLKEGDVVFVEGELVRDQAQAPGSTWKQYPTYRVREVQLVQRKN
jgi:homeobox protein ESX1